MDGDDFCRCYGDFESTWLQLRSKFFLNNYKAPWQRHLKDTLLLKTLWTWINIGVGPATIHLTYYCMLLLLSSKPSFKIESSVDRIIFATIYLPFYLSIFCVSWSLEVHLVSLRFFHKSQQNSDEAQCCLLWRFTATKCYHFFILRGTFLPVNGEN